MLKRFLLTLAVSSVCATTGFAQDVIVFDNVAGLTVDNAVASDTGAFIASANVDDVTFAADTSVIGIDFSGIYAASPLPGGDSFIAAADDNFTISLFLGDGAGSADTATGPVAAFAVGNNVNRTTGSNPDLANSFDYSADIAFDFLADVTYFVAIVNTSPAGDTDQFNQGTTSVGGNALSTFDPANFSGLIQQTFATDFQLRAAAPAVIPEPSSLALLALGCTGLVARRRRS